MKIDAGAWKIISCSKIQACTSENIAPKSKTYHVFLNRPLFLSNLTQWLLPYLIVFATISLPFYLLIIGIKQILKFIQCLHIFFYKNQWNFDEAQCSFFKVFSLNTLLCSYFMNYYPDTYSKNGFIFRHRFGKTWY